MNAAGCTDVDVPYAPAVRQSPWKYAEVVRQTTAISSSSWQKASALDTYYGHQFCFVMTLGQALPWFFVIISGFYVLLSMLRLPIIMISASVQFLVQAVSFTHVE